MQGDRGLPLTGASVGRRASAPHSREAIKSLVKEMGARGLVLTKCGASSIRIAPPLIITRDQADFGVDVITEVVRRNQW